MAYISEVKLPNNSSYKLKDATLHYYAVCGTVAATATKSITLANFTLETNTRITITFTYANTASSPALSINEGNAISFATNTEWNDGDTLDFIYDGTNWVPINYNRIEVIRL